MAQTDRFQGLFPYLIYYHTVFNNQPHLKHLNHLKTTAELTADLDYLAARYEFISLDEFRNLLESGQQKGKRKIVLTFDDGYREISDIVQPLLLKKGIPAAIFITGNFLDNRDMFYRCKVSLLCEFIINTGISLTQYKAITKACHIPVSSIQDIYQYLLGIRLPDKLVIDDIAEIAEIDFQEYLARVKPYLTTKQVQSLIASGFEIGAHSMDHPFYGIIPLREQLVQTFESMNTIQNAFHLPYRYFALPHSDAGLSTSYFYLTGKELDLQLGGFGINSYPNHHYYQRFSIERYHTEPTLSWQTEVAKNKLMKVIHPAHLRFTKRG